MKQVNIETVRERMNEIEMWRGTSNLSVSLKEEFELACLRVLVASLSLKPELWEIENPGEGTYFVWNEPHAQDWRKNLIVQRWYAGPPVHKPAPERDQVRADHAEWSQATFGSVGPIGPLKHLAKEAMEAAAAPGDLSEWADMQFLLWDAQRRAGITDDQITQAMIDKLAVNKARQWPEPKDGEPRLHVKCTHAICRDGCCNTICPDCLENIHEVREPYSTAYLSSAVVPAGWVLMPLVPTQEMCDAVLGRACFSSDGDGARYIFNAMLKHAPAAPHESPVVVIPTIWKHYGGGKVAHIYEQAMDAAGVKWRSVDDEPQQEPVTDNDNRQYEALSVERAKS